MSYDNDGDSFPAPDIVILQIKRKDNQHINYDVEYEIPSGKRERIDFILDKLGEFLDGCDFDKYDEVIMRVFDKFGGPSE